MPYSFVCPACHERLSDSWWSGDAAGRCIGCAGLVDGSAPRPVRRLPPPKRPQAERTSWLIDPPKRTQKKPKQRLTKREKRRRRAAKKTAPAAPEPIAFPRCEAPMRTQTERYRDERPAARCARCGTTLERLSAEAFSELTFAGAPGERACPGCACPGCQAPMRAAVMAGRRVQACASCRRLLLEA